MGLLEQQSNAAGQNAGILTLSLERATTKPGWHAGQRTGRACLKASRLGSVLQGPQAAPLTKASVHAAAMITRLTGLERSALAEGFARAAEGFRQLAARPNV